MMSDNSREASLMANRIGGSSRVSDGDEMRPDGRTLTPETRKLRVATRALRYHLDTLPIDCNVDVSGDRFLAGLAFMFARQRYDCADSMIGAGFGGTVLGSVARNLFVDGLRWLWISEQPERRYATPCSATCLRSATASASCLRRQTPAARSCPAGSCLCRTSRTWLASL